MLTLTYIIKVKVVLIYQQIIPYGMHIWYNTPGGKSDLDNKSNISISGLYEISIIRLWIRISKCSRESLSTWGERKTQYIRLSVGNGTIL